MEKMVRTRSLTDRAAEEEEKILGGINVLSIFFSSWQMINFYLHVIFLGSGIRGCQGMFSLDASMVVCRTARGRRQQPALK